MPDRAQHLPVSQPGVPHNASRVAGALFTHSCPADPQSSIKKSNHLRSPGQSCRMASPFSIIVDDGIAPVAQLDRASVYGTEGWGFESLQARSKTQVCVGVCSFGRLSAWRGVSVFGVLNNQSRAKQNRPPEISPKRAINSNYIIQQPV